MTSEQDYSQFSEYLQLKGYSRATVVTTIKTVQYFARWAAGEQIESLEEIHYNDAMGFMQWCAKQGMAQKTVANYLLHVRKYYSFLISTGAVRENPVAHIKVQGIKRKVYYDILTPSELTTLYEQYPVSIDQPEGKIMPPQEKNILSRKRNKVIVSLLINQGLRVEEIAALQLADVGLREGKITIHARRRTAGRVMELASHQVYEMLDYVQEVRKAFLRPDNVSAKLFTQWHGGANFYGITQSILGHLGRINGRVRNFDQIRASVITQWLKQYDLRKVQYLAGHRYVSSTEAYKVNVIDGLQEDVSRYHPL